MVVGPDGLRDTKCSPAGHLVVTSLGRRALWVAVIVVVVLLTYAPVLALGPILEHLSL